MALSFAPPHLLPMAGKIKDTVPEQSSFSALPDCLLMNLPCFTGTSFSHCRKRVLPYLPSGSLNRWDTEKAVLMRVLIILILILLPGSVLLSKGQVLKQPGRLLPLANSNSLSNNRVYSIVQDKQGYMWFGTEEGLNRYNGQSTTVFRFRPGDPGSLHSNFISRMLVDQRGFIWIGSNGGGLSYYNPLSGTFTAYRHEVDNPNSLPSNHVQFLLESRKGEIWIGADNGGGLIRMDPHTKKFTQYIPNRDTIHAFINSQHSNSVLSSEDEDGTLWLGTRDGLYHFNPQRKFLKDTGIIRIVKGGI